MDNSRIAEKSSARGVMAAAIHPSWQRLMDYCHQLNHGELAKVMIQDGLPVCAEYVKKKVKFI